MTERRMNRMGNKGRSEPGLFGSYNHYDEHGRKTGHSDPGLFGGYTNFDAKGNKIGRSDPSLFGGYDHYDNHGKKIGHSDPGLFGSYNHYDSHGNRTGTSDPGLFGGYSNSSDGCYIATCVYGSYDTPEVWTLRRFRDSYLGQRLWGRAFIRTYYAVSPKLVSCFGCRSGFRDFWRKILNRFTVRLKGKGYDDSPYEDVNWRKQNRQITDSNMSLDGRRSEND